MAGSYRELREKMRMTNMLNNKMFFISKEYSDNYSCILYPCLQGKWQSLKEELDKNN